MMTDSRFQTRFWRIALPLLVGVAVLLVWQGAVTAFDVPSFVLPAPTLIAESLVANFGSLMGSLVVTLRVTVAAFLLASVGGVALAILFVQNRAVETALFPYAIILQVTPVVAIAPLILIWVGFDQVELALLILAWIVAFFPVLSNTVLGLRSVDHNLTDLFRLYGASRLQTLIELQLPAALPYILAGMKISGGLALIGAVVAEFVAGSGASTGLAWRIVEAGNRLDIPKMFAALFLLSLLGIAIFFLLSLVEYLLLRRWHESVIRREG
ncbi:ABC transporter permease [Parvibaculum sp. MBR-TMA-1.3b-4.2]|jgi:NitT/TauT family transport system permease protein